MESNGVVKESDTYGAIFPTKARVESEEGEGSALGLRGYVQMMSALRGGGRGEEHQNLSNEVLFFDLLGEGS